MDQRPGSGNASDRLSEKDIEFLDRLLQDLFGVGLKLEYCLSVIDDAPSQARTGLKDVVSSLDDMVEPIRALIHRLDESQ